MVSEAKPDPEKPRKSRWHQEGSLTQRSQEEELEASGPISSFLNHLQFNLFFFSASANLKSYFVHWQFLAPDNIWKPQIPIEIVSPLIS